MQDVLLQATIYLLAAIVAVPLSMRLGLGSVMGYLIAGIALGPILGFTGTDMASVREFAEFGVVLMLFLIGLELEPRILWGMRTRLVGLGGLQVVLTTALVAYCASWLGQAWPTALAIGLIFSLSSTAIVLQTLTEKGLIQTPGGRSTFSVLLTQDVAVIPMLALLPLLAPPVGATIAPDGSLQIGTGAAEAEHTVSLVQDLPAWGVTLVTLGAVAFIAFAGVFLLRPIFHYIHGSRLRELNTAFALLIVVGIAALMQLVGLSPALGTFLAGVVLANSEFRHELEADIAPFKGLLLGLFFITVGLGINFETLIDRPFVIFGLTLGMMFAKAIVLLPLGLLFRLRGRDLWLFTLGLAQAGEFGFVLISFALQQDVLPPGHAQTLLLVVALSMLLTPLFFIFYEKLPWPGATPGETVGESSEIESDNPIIIAGLGRFGQGVNRLVRMAGIQTTLLDKDLGTIRLMRKFGFNGFLGDPTRPELLHASGLSKARVLVVAFDDHAAALRLVQMARRERPDLHIIARAKDQTHVFELYKAGADEIVRELFDSSLRAGRYVLERMGVGEYDASDLEHEFYRLDRRAMLELAELWDPAMPISKNTAYLDRARELNKELDVVLAATRAKRAKDEKAAEPPAAKEAAD